jgi:hypothetical protein
MIAALTLAASLATAQAPNQAIVADLGLHVIGVGYHRSLSERVVGSISLDLYVPWTFTQNAFGLSGNYRSDLAGIVVRVRPFIFLWRGLWVSPFLQGGPAKAGDAWGIAAAAGAAVGYAFVLFDHLLLSPGLGVQGHSAWMGGNGPPSFLGVWPHVDLLVGYTW